MYLSVNLYRLSISIYIDLFAVFISIPSIYLAGSVASILIWQGNMGSSTSTNRSDAKHVFLSANGDFLLKKPKKIQSSRHPKWKLHIIYIYTYLVYMYIFFVHVYKNIYIYLFVYKYLCICSYIHIPISSSHQ